MAKSWKLLTEEHIYRLKPAELASYTAWLQEYKREQDIEITEKKALLNRIVKEKERKQKVVEEESIAALRNFLQK